MKLKGTHKRPRTGVPSCIMRSKRFAFGDGVLGGDGANGVVDGEKDADADEAEVEAAAGGTKRVEDPSREPSKLQTRSHSRAQASGVFRLRSSCLSVA